jgi:hypothetical protein
VTHRRYVTAPVPFGARGDVCPEPAMIGTKLRQPARSATAVGAAISNGGQGGRQAFAVDRREVPT